MPTHQQKLEAIRRAAIAANPEIVELKPGCEFYQKNRKTGEVLSDAVYVFVGRGIDSREIKFSLTDRYVRDEIGCYDGYAYNEVQTEKNMEGYIEIIGRPIRLADVMLAIGRREDRIHVTCDGWFCILQTPMHEFARRFQWNLRKDSLDEQGPETIDFLYELLK